MTTAVVSKDLVKIEKGSEEWKFLQKRYAPTSTDLEFEYLMYDHNRLGIHLADGLINFIKYAGKPYHVRTIYFLLKVARDTGELAGIPEAVVTGTPGKPGFTVVRTVYRRDKITKEKDAYVGKAKWEEFLEKSSNPIAKGMPENQLAKCALAQALRFAFPVECGSEYIEEEMVDRTPSLAVTSKDLAGDLAADTWIVGKYHEFIKGSGTHPSVLLIETEAGPLMTLHILASFEGEDSQYEKGDPIRIQYSKARGGFKAVTAIERIAQDGETITEYEKSLPSVPMGEIPHDKPEPQSEPPPELKDYKRPMKAVPKYKPGIPSPPEGFSSWMEKLRSHLGMNFVGQAAQNAALVNATKTDTLHGWESMKALEASHRPELMAKIALEKMVKP